VKGTKYEVSGQINMLTLFTAFFFLGLSFDPEDGSGLLLRTVDGHYWETCLYAPEENIHVTCYCENFTKEVAHLSTIFSSKIN
jgi:hypothetical protein